MSAARKLYSFLTPPERRRLAWLAGLMTSSAVLETFGIGLVIPAIAVLTQPDLASAYPAVVPALNALGNPPQAVIVSAGMFLLVVAYFAKSAFAAFVVSRQTRFTFELQGRLSDRLFTLYLRQPYAFHLQRNSAQLIRNLVNEVRELSLTAVMSGMLLVTEGLVICGIATLLLFVQPVGAIAVVTVLGLAVAAYQRAIAPHVRRWGQERQHHEGMRIQHLQQGLGSVKDVKVLGCEEEFAAQHHEHNIASARAARQHYTLLEVPRLGLEFLGVVGLTVLVLTMLAGGRDVSAIVPTLGLFAAAAFRLMPSLNRMVVAMHSWRYGLVVIEHLHEELQLPVPDTATSLRTIRGFQAELRLYDVSYTYPTGPAPALTRVSLEVRRGESIGFVGASGSGKSTLVDVILGLLTPQAGEVVVDGCDIQSDLRGWQDQVGYVPQSIALTDDTIRRNVAFGVAEAEIDDAAVTRALRAAQLEAFVAGLPGGTETTLGERGVRLSGGQRQRLGIARALYQDPPILVLDEATSALDTETEAGIMEAVTALHGQKTIVIVAHRLSTVEHCDRLYRLEAGRVVQEGAFADMLLPRVG